jgi:hypothetical protein
VSAQKLFVAAYLLGCATFTCAVGMIILNALSITDVDPKLPLFGGFALMIGSKFASARTAGRSERA